MKIVAKNFPFSKEICKFEKGKNFCFGKYFFWNLGYKKPASSAILFPLAVIRKQMQMEETLLTTVLKAAAGETLKKNYYKYDRKNQNR